MKNNLLTTNPEEIAKLYLQPLVSNLNNLTVYGGKRLTEPITIFIKGTGIKLDNYLYELEQLGNVYNPDNLDYINEYEFSVYSGRNLTVNNVDKVTVNNIPIKKIIEDKFYWNYPYVFDNLENWYCVLIYGILDEYEEDGELYVWNKLNDIYSLNTTKYDVISIPSQSIVILPKLLEEMPTGKSRKDLRLLEGYYSISEATSIILNFESTYSTELEVISDYGESQGSHLWNCYLYCKQNFSEDTYKPVVYITSDTLPTLSNAYSLNNVKVKFLNPLVGVSASMSTQYWIDLDLDISGLGFVKFLMNSLTSNSIIVYYKIESVGTYQITLNNSGITGMIVDNGEEELYLGNDYNFTTIGTHKIEFLLNSSYTALGPVFLLIPEASIIILPTQITSFSGTNMFGAFSGSKLNYILFPAISKLSSGAIYSTNNTLNLKALVFTGVTPPTIGSTNTFDQLNILSIYVPASAVDAYKTAWPTYTNIIQAIPE